MSASPDDAPSAEARRSGRIAAAILVAFAIVLAIAASQIEYAFSSDPLGPRAFPYILAAALAISGVWYFMRPGGAEPWPEPAVLRHSFVLIATTILAIALMDQIGFLPAAFIVCAVASYLFGASPGMAAVIGALQALFWFALFKYALGTYLPSGSWFFPG